MNNKSKFWSSLPVLTLAAAFSLAAQPKCRAQSIATNDVGYNSVQVIPEANNILEVNDSLPVFNAYRAQEFADSITATKTTGLCAQSFRKILATGGIHVPFDANGKPPAKASLYGNILPQLGFVSLETGDGTAFDVDEIRQRVASTMGDPDHPVAVVMYEKDDPTAAGHIFYVTANRGTYSDFDQFGGTGLTRPQDFTYQAFVYDGPVRGYNVWLPHHVFASHHQNKRLTHQYAAAPTAGQNILDLN